MLEVAYKKYQWSVLNKPPGPKGQRYMYYFMTYFTGRKGHGSKPGTQVKMLKLLI